MSVVMDGTNTKVKGMVELTPKQVAELLAKDLILDITSLLGAVD